MIIIIKKHLSRAGYFAILLPYQRIQYFEDMAEENNLFLQQKLLIRQTPSHNFFRGILFFSDNKYDPKTNELTIKNNDSYSEDFTILLRDYYLKL